MLGVLCEELSLEREREREMRSVGRGELVKDREREGDGDDGKWEREKKKKKIWERREEDVVFELLKKSRKDVSRMSLISSKHGKWRLFDHWDYFTIAKQRPQERSQF